MEHLLGLAVADGSLMCLANGGGGAILNHPIKLEGAQYSLVSTQKGSVQLAKLYASSPLNQVLRA